MPCAAAPHAFLRVTGHRRPGPPPSPWTCDEDQLLVLLVITWALATGRIPPDRPADQLTVTELIAFWADDHTATGIVPGPSQE